MTSEEKRIMAGILFRPGDPELKALKLKAHNLNIDYNRLYEHQKEEREAILRELLGQIGEGAFPRDPSPSTTAAIPRSARALSSISTSPSRTMPP